MSIDFSKFTTDVRNAIEASARIATQLGSSEVNHLHLMAGLASVAGQEVAAVLQSSGYDMDASMNAVAQAMCAAVGGPCNAGVGFSEEVVSSFMSASMLPEVNVAALVNAMVDNPSQVLRSCFKCLPVPLTPSTRPDCPVDYRDYQRDAETTGKTVKKFCTNMLELAATGKIGHAIGRDDEVMRVLLILARNTKNNPVLVGEPGTGKTAIAEELAMRLYEGNVPEDLADLKLYSLDFTSIKSLPDSIGVMKAILDEAIADQKLVLFIDEIHMLISSCSCSDNDIANLLKPAMARGEINIFGATTIDEYKKIEKDPAFERRFQKVIVDEPDIESAIKIIDGSKAKFENYHSVQIPSEVSKAAVTLSDRYITNRKLPDKAFDLIDEAAANLRIQNSDRRVLNVNDLMKVVTDWTGIPVEEMDENEAQRLQNIETELRASVVGQDKAVKMVSDAIRRNRMGFSDASRPIGSFLFLGTTGTGKTELCKAVAKFLFRDSDMMVRIDMSEYQQEHSVARLFGAPPGYVGYEQGGQLTEAVRRKPFSVVLFDEIEKAHPKIFETLLQVLDDGRMTDGQGKVVDFKNTIIVMTSNMGQQHILATLCHNTQPVTEEDVEVCKSHVLNELKRRVAPEFVNRIDNIVMFHPLTKEDVAKIAVLQINKEVKKLDERGIHVQVDQSAIDFVVDRGYIPEYGGRPIKRAIVDNIINPLTSALLSSSLNRNSTIYVNVMNNQINFTNGTTTRI